VGLVGLKDWGFGEMEGKGCQSLRSIGIFPCIKNTRLLNLLQACAWYIQFFIIAHRLAWVCPGALGQPTFWLNISGGGPCHQVYQKVWFEKETLCWSHTNTFLLSRLDTLILAISDAGDDIVNSVALKHAIGVDPKGKRTLGVVSKLDKVAGAEKEKSLLRVLKNETLPLAKGYVGVINANETQVILN